MNLTSSGAPALFNFSFSLQEEVIIDLFNPIGNLVACGRKEKEERKRERERERGGERKREGEKENR